MHRSIVVFFYLISAHVLVNCVTGVGEMNAFGGFAVVKSGDCGMNELITAHPVSSRIGITKV